MELDFKSVIESQSYVTPLQFFTEDVPCAR